MPESKCYAPCIIGNDHGFRALFCTLEKHGTREHSTMCGDFTVTWYYLGVSETIESAIPVYDERCSYKAEISAPAMTDDCLKAPFSTSPRRRLADEALHFDCERIRHGKAIEHVRVGVYRPLGIEWKITWR